MGASHFYFLLIPRPLLARFNADQSNKKINVINKDIGALMKAGKKDEAGPLLEEKDKIIAEKDKLNVEADELEKERDRKLGLLGNIVHESCIDSLDEVDNAIVSSYWPEDRNEAAERERKEKLIGKDGKGVPGLYSHHEVLLKIEGYEPERGGWWCAVVPCDCDASFS